MRPESLAFLESLLNAPSPSGFERAGQRLWLEYTRPFADRCWNDAYGNCFAELTPAGGGEGLPTVAVCGHADEIGLMVNHVDDKGFIYCRAIGGIDVGQIVGKRLRFLSTVPGAGEVVGLIGATAIHLQDRSGDPKVRKMHELFVDIGAPDREAALARVNIGDPAVFSDGFLRLGDDLIVARGLDNRIGTFAAAETLRRCRERREELRVRVVAVSTVQEEIGLNGAAMIAESLRPQVCLVTDVGHATDSPGISQAQHGQFKLGGGPKIAIGAALQPEVVQRLLATAGQLGITVQRSATAGRSGTDTDAIFTRAGGIPSGLVSLPIRYMHTTVEMTSLRDLDAIGQIFAGFCLGLAPDDRFVPSL
jgi:putative aminopeptidase FrvX